MPHSLPILIVDDSPLIGALLQRQLKFLGEECEYAAGGEEALARTREKSYALILMDLEMPGMSGLEAAKLFRDFESPRGEHTPVVGFTAHYSKKQLCLAAGMDDFLPKPALLQDLKLTLSRWLRKTIL